MAIPPTEYRRKRQHSMLAIIGVFRAALVSITLIERERSQHTLVAQKRAFSLSGKEHRSRQRQGGEGAQGRDREAVATPTKYFPRTINFSIKGLGTILYIQRSSSRARLGAACCLSSWSVSARHIPTAAIFPESKGTMADGMNVGLEEPYQGHFHFVCPPSKQGHRQGREAVCERASESSEQLSSKARHKCSIKRLRPVSASLQKRIMETGSGTGKRTD